MSKENLPLVIVGTGAAGYGLLRALRRRDQSCDIVLITSDDGAAYSKSELPFGMQTSKEASELVLASSRQMSQRFDATVLTHTRVQTIDRSRRTLLTARRQIPYSRLILATGSEAVRATRLRGSAVDQVLTLTTLADYRYFRNELAGRRRVVIHGGGVAGCEFADNLTRAGCEVTLFEPGSRLLGSRLPALCASRLARLLGKTGVRVVLEDGITRVDQGVDELELTARSGVRLVADVLVAALGSRPRIQLAHDAGLQVGRGIKVDSALRTDDPNIFALGECAEVDGRLLLLPEDIDAACRALADNLLGGNAQMHWKPRLQRLQLEACPVVLCEPPQASGEWYETATPRGVKAVFHDSAGDLRGFILVGDTTDQAEQCFRRMSL